MNSIPLILSCGVGAGAYLILISWKEIWDGIASRYVADLRPTLVALGIDQSQLPRYLRLWGGAMLLSLLTIFFMPPLSVALIILVYLTPRAYLQNAIVRRRNLLRDQLVGATLALSNTTRAGLSLSQGMDSVSVDSPPEIKQELDLILRDFNHGVPLSQAIESAKNRLQHDSFTLMSAALLTSIERGGRISDALERISRSLQENQRLERKMDSETASGRRVLKILAVFPIVFLVIFMVAYPEGTMQLVGTLHGQLILLLVVALIVVSVVWGQRILKLE